MSKLFLTPYFCEQEVLYRKAVSPAANKWLLHITTAVLKLEKVEVLGHLPEPLWPKGEITPVCLISNKTEKTQSLYYLNAPFLKSVSLFLSYLVALTRLFIKFPSEEYYVITYNPSNAIQKLIRLFRLKRKLTWVSIVADGDAPSKADGLIFLSYGYYKAHPMMNAKKMHLDGALYKNLASVDTQMKASKTVLMYSGTSSKWGGVSYLLDAYLKACKNVELELWISGAGDYSQFSKQYSHEPSIKFLGMLSQSELEERYKQADIFVNPRPELYDNDKNFPSKLFDYLSYGKPVISFKTSGLSPQYDDLLIFPDQNSVKALANSIKEVINWTDHERQLYASKLDHYASTVTWDVQAKRFLQFVESL